jgi:hypothetical protein
VVKWPEDARVLQQAPEAASLGRSLSQRRREDSWYIFTSDVEVGTFSPSLLGNISTLTLPLERCPEVLDLMTGVDVS